MRLGQMIQKLAALPADLPVRFVLVGDVDGVIPDSHPDGLASYRGFYDRLALGSGGALATVEALLTEARHALGKTFEGYKGGEFTMDEFTPIHVAPWGESYGNQLVGIERRGDWVALLVANCCDY